MPTRSGCGPWRNVFYLSEKNSPDKYEPWQRKRYREPESKQPPSEDDAGAVSQTSGAEDAAGNPRLRPV